MKDGETMRNLIHGGDRAASDAVLQALIAYYESRDKGQLVERMAQIGLDYPFIGFWKQRRKTKTATNRAQPGRTGNNEAFAGIFAADWTSFGLMTRPVKRRRFLPNITATFSITAGPVIILLTRLCPLRL